MFPVFAFIAVVALVPPFIRLAPVLKLVDAPDGPQGRKRHDGVIPLIGGLIVFPVFIAVSVFAGYGVSAYWPLYTAIAMLLVLGAVDDKRHVRPAIKFFVQCLAAALVVVAGEAQLYQLGDMFGLGKIGLEFMALPFSWIAVVLLINAVNLMDGLDGLAAGYGAIALGWIAFGFFSAGDSVAALHIGIVIGALAGFLVYNMRHPLRRKACVFLGDAGSLSLGLTLAWFAIDVTKEPRAALVPISVAWILALPIFDICAQFYRRVRLGKHPFAPDRGH
ncbi:MAG: MraY family glycosyltransferase, partial [Bdellovibrionales bacterium]